jgi:hypothetical protein
MEVNTSHIYNNINRWIHVHSNAKYCILKWHRQTSLNVLGRGEVVEEGMCYL